MKIKWHCRNCNETGEQDIKLDDIIKSYKPKETNLISLAISKVDHKCDNPQIGVRVK